MILLGIAALTSVVAEPRTLNLASDDRYALMAAIESKVGGKFIVTGIANAGQSCAMIRACVSGEDIQTSATAARSEEITSVDELIASSNVYGSRPVAIVSFRTAQWGSGSDIRLIASVYDPVTKTWSEKLGVLGKRPVPNVSGSFYSKLDKWINYSAKPE